MPPGLSISGFRESYGAKALAGFLAVVVAIAVIGGYLYVSTDSQLTASARADLEGTATQQATQIDRWIGNSRAAARFVAGSEAVRSGDPSTIQPYLESLAESGDLTTGARAVHYVDAATTEIEASSLDSRVGGNPRQEGAPWARQDLSSLGDDEVLITAFQPNVTNATVMTFVTPVAGSEGGAVVYVTDVGAVANQLQQGSDTAYTTVVNSKGVVVLDQRDAGNVGQQYLDDSRSVSGWMDGRTGFAILDSDQTPMGIGRQVMGYTATESQDWTVLVADSPSDVFGLRRSVTMGVLLLLGVAVLGLALIGLAIVRPTLTSIRQLATRAEQMENGDLSVNLESSRRDEIGDLYRAFDGMRGSLKERIQHTESLLDHLQAKASSYQAVMEATANGDLTRRMDPESENEAMRDIAVTFNDMIDDLETTITSVQSFADTVAESSETLTASVEEIETASHEVSQSIQEISDGSVRQTDQLTQVAGEMDTLSATIEEVASSAEEVASMSDRATERGEAGRERAETAVSRMRAIDRQTDDTVTAVETLDEQVAEIDDIVALIDDIAEQTNTLALNANVEAARADRGGEGFAVVANEVKELAAETSEATDEIENLIQQIQRQTEASVEEMREMQTRVGDGLEAVTGAVDEFETVVSEIEEANAGVQEIDDATDEQASSTQEVVTMVDDVTGISEETSAEAQNVSAAAEEQTSSLTEVAGKVEQLSDRALDLQDVLAEFTVDTATDPRPAGPGRSPSGRSGGTDAGRRISTD